MDTIPAGTYIVAVSGGVDSIVLLDMLVKQARHNLIVAHFDHGTRPDSADDAQFVRTLANQYGLTFETRREELGSSVSEEHARGRRYEFLHAAAQKHQAVIITAHHADDVVETIAINLQRGTGWRGLAVLDSPGIVRPLLHMRKKELIDYAKKYQLEWREDSTNAQATYLRNRLRRKLVALNDDYFWQLIALRDLQIATKQAIAKEVAAVLSVPPYSRYFFTMIPEAVAAECLREVCRRVGGTSPVLSQLSRAARAIKTAAAKTNHDIGDGLYLEFTRTEFIVKTSGR